MGCVRVVQAMLGILINAAFLAIAVIVGFKMFPAAVPAIVLAWILGWLAMLVTGIYFVPTNDVRDSWRRGRDY